MLGPPLIESYTSYRGNVSAILRAGGCGCPHVGLTFAHGQLHFRRNSRGCVLWSSPVCSPNSIHCRLPPRLWLQTSMAQSQGRKCHHQALLRHIRIYLTPLP